MNPKLRKGITIAAVCLVLAGLCGWAGWYGYSHVFVDGKVYPKGQQLDLRGTVITPEHHDAIQAQLPECDIWWDVPFQGSHYPHDTKELTITALEEGDIAALDYLPQLESIRWEGTPDFAVLDALVAHRPEVLVEYAVTIDGRMYPWDTRELILTAISDDELALLPWLPEVATVDATGLTDLTRLAPLQAALPECAISYQVAIGEETFLHTTESLTLTGTDPEELARQLAYLPQVTAVSLTDPQPKAESLLALPEQYPDVTFSWTSQLCGLTLTQDTTQVDLTDVPQENTDTLKTVLSCYPNVEKLILSGCGLDNETLAAFREEVRAEYKVVWTVQLGPLKARTDDTYFMPTKYGKHVDDTQIQDLKYCEDMIGIDLGHQSITHCDWAAYMPHLKYLVLADAPVTDITGLTGRTELVFLEMFINHPPDLSPLETLTALEDLNLSYVYCDPTPITRMTWLKRLWWADCPWSEYTFRQYLPDTELCFIRRSSTGGTWRQGQNYYDMRDLMGMYYMLG